MQFFFRASRKEEENQKNLKMSNTVLQILSAGRPTCFGMEMGDQAIPMKKMRRNFFLLLLYFPVDWFLSGSILFLDEIL